MHARERGAEAWWKSFATGKSAETLGGVPHDAYGMTSLSIRQYVLGIYKQLGLREKDITKVQTGGPGACSRAMSCVLLHLADTGSTGRRGPWIQYVSPRASLVGIMPDMSTVDEILLSSDKTVAVIDGSGVLADPVGINREELIRLAKLRIPVANFDKSKLSKDGYLVRVEDQDFKLPCEQSLRTKYSVLAGADQGARSG